MAERPEDLNLPAAIVARLVKDALPEGINVSKEARAAIARAASVFILYTTSCSNNVATKAGRKTLLGPDVIQAMTDMDFESFSGPLQEALEGNSVKIKKRAPCVHFLARPSNINNRPSLPNSVNIYKIILLS
jgi:histone H3/H4